MTGIGLITNVNSTRNKAGAYRWDKMEALLASRGAGPLMGRDTSSVTEVRDVVREFRDKGVEIVCVNGGDGTQHYVANEIAKAYGTERPLPVLVPLKGGAMNMLAKNLGVTGTPAESMARVADLARAWRDQGTEPPTAPLNTLQVDCPALGYRGIGFVYATGIAYKLLVEYYEGGNPSFRNALKVVTSTISGFVLGRGSARSAFQREPIRIAADARELPFTTAFIACASTVPSLVLWFRPFKSDHMIPAGEGFYFMANDMDDWDVIRNVSSLSKGGYAHDRLFNEVVRSTTIESSCGFTLDGELFSPPGTVDLTLSQGPTFRSLVL